MESIDNAASPRTSIDQAASSSFFASSPSNTKQKLTKSTSKSANDEDDSAIQIQLEESLAKTSLKQIQSDTTSLHSTTSSVESSTVANSNDSPHVRFSTTTSSQQKLNKSNHYRSTPSSPSLTKTTSPGAALAAETRRPILKTSLSIPSAPSDIKHPCVADKATSKVNFAAKRPAKPGGSYSGLTTFVFVRKVHAMQNFHDILKKKFFLFFL